MVVYDPEDPHLDLYDVDDGKKTGNLSNELGQANGRPFRYYCLGLRRLVPRSRAWACTSVSFRHLSIYEKLGH
jgi:hypothetical protein